MDIHPHRGIDALLLGATRVECASRLGRPDRSSQDRHEDGEVSEIWTYRMLRLELSFDSDHDYRLSHITSYHPYSLVRGFNPIGLTAKLLLMKYPHLDLDVEVSADEKYYSDRVLDLTFGIARGKVVSVTVFPEYDESGEHVLWPSAAAAAATDHDDDDGDDDRTARADRDHHRDPLHDDDGARPPGDREEE